jgi:hypothetical protein
MRSPEKVVKVTNAATLDFATNAVADAANADADTDVDADYRVTTGYDAYRPDRTKPEWEELQTRHMHLLLAQPSLN